MSRPVPVSFLRGAALLSAAGLLSRLFGLYRLVLPALMGAAGVGLYHMAYPVYAVALTLSTGGLPVAISKLVAERAAAGRHREARRVFLVSLLALAPLGALLAAALILSAPLIAHDLARDPRAVLSIRSIAPAVFLVAGMSAYRGYFQGYQNMIPTAVSQLLEQASRVAAILALVALLAPLGLAWQAAGATFGAVVGALVGMVFLIAVDARWRRPADWASSAPAEPTGRILRSLLVLALPVALAGLAVPLMQLGDLVIVPSRLLAEGVGTLTRTALYGELAGYAMPVANLPSIVTIAVAVALVPAVAEGRARGEAGEVERRYHAALRAANMIALPASVGLWMMGPAIMELLFGNPSAGAILQMLAPSVFLLGVVQITSGALQGSDGAVVAVRNIFLGLAVKLLLTWVLVPPMGVKGAALATSVGYGFAGLLNLVSLARLGLGPAPVATFLRPAMGLPFLAVFAHLALVFGTAGRIGALEAVMAGAIGYFVGMILLRGITDDDLDLIPGGASLRRLLQAGGLWRH